LEGKSGESVAALVQYGGDKGYERDEEERENAGDGGQMVSAGPWIPTAHGLPCRDDEDDGGYLVKPGTGAVAGDGRSLCSGDGLAGGGLVLGEYKKASDADRDQ